MRNHLKNQTSPYLLQHVNNPVNWYPWCEEAFEKAKKEDKPIFLSIGYSTCHWCHVMAHESFEDNQVADVLNRYFVSIKVDKEERPDIDSIYMSVCQAMTGSGGWPTTIFLTPEQKPFFAGTYFPKHSQYGRIGLVDLLLIVNEKWKKERDSLLNSADEVIAYLNNSEISEKESKDSNSDMIRKAVEIFKNIYDEDFGGFGRAPKFPTPHNLLFLMSYYEQSKDETVLKMVEKTLLQMYRGGIFDHIGGGFSRYSTDTYFLVPHFEKMLYDNALLILAYCKAYEITNKSIYMDIAKKTAAYVIREMTHFEGGFYSAQDADSEGVEGKYYLLEPSETLDILGEEVGKRFNEYFDISEKGNFEGKNIPNLLKSDVLVNTYDNYLELIYDYRKNRYLLHLDDKILTSWNGLMISAMCHLYRISKDKMYLDVATRAHQFIMDHLYENGTLFVSFRDGMRHTKGFLDDYATEIYALLGLYDATLDKSCLDKAERFCNKAVTNFFDEEKGGFFLYGKENERLILKPKDTYDGAIPSGNSLMAYNLIRLYQLTGQSRYEKLVKKQIKFMNGEIAHYPAGYTMFLTALLEYLHMPDKVTVVVKDKKDIEGLSEQIPLNTLVCVTEEETEEYPYKNDRTTFYVCKGQMCLAPVNDLSDIK